MQQSKNELAVQEYLKSSPVQKHPGKASVRTISASRSIYLSRQMPMTNGKPVLADLGSARFGHSEYQGDIMPLVYRAPEVILGMKWSSKVDVWSVGVMVSRFYSARELQADHF